MIRKFVCLIVVVLAIAATACASGGRGRQQVRQVESAPTVDPIARAEIALSQEHEWIENRSSKDAWVVEQWEIPNIDGSPNVVWIGLIKPGQKVWVPKLLEGMKVGGYFLSRKTRSLNTEGVIERDPIYLIRIDNFGWTVNCGPHC